MNDIQTVELDDECEEFMAVLPSILEDILEGIDDGLFNLKDHIRDLLDYTIPKNRRIRSLIVATVYRMFEKRENITPENIRGCYVMGWILEIGFVAETILSDIMERKSVRQGVPCWHTRNNIGSIAINDGLLLEQSVYHLLRKHFACHPNVISIYKLFHDVALKSSSGKALDRSNRKCENPDLTIFTIDNYKNLVKHNTAYYSFCGAAELAMYLANISDENLHKKARIIFLEIGELFQIQDDYLDCFGEVEKTGDRGRYIRDGKCTWLAVKALERATPTQRKIMEKYYGTEEPKAVETICDLYEKLDLVKVYSEHEEESLEKMHSILDLVSEDLPIEMFGEIVEKLYNKKL